MVLLTMVEEKFWGTRLQSIHFLHHLTSKIMNNLILHIYMISWAPSYSIIIRLCKDIFRFTLPSLFNVGEYDSLECASIFSNCSWRYIFRFWWISLYFILCCVNGEYSAQTRHFNCFCSIIVYRIYEVVKGNLKMKWIFRFFYKFIFYIW